MLEKLVEDRLVREVKKIGGKAYKLESLGNSGMPDRLIILPLGRTVFVETKKPKNGRLSKIQIYRIKELEKLGADVRVISTYAEINKFIQEVKKWNTHHTIIKST